MKGAIVTLRWNEGNEGRSYRQLTNFRGVTDAKGEYRILNVPAGNYLVSPIAAAFVVDSGLRGERPLTVNEGQTIENFDFSVVRGGAITGRVMDLDGRPVIEEEVFLSSPSNPQYGSPLRLQSLTIVESIESLPCGRANTQSRREETMPAETRAVRVALSSGGPITLESSIRRRPQSLP